MGCSLTATPSPTWCVFPVTAVTNPPQTRRLRTTEVCPGPDVEARRPQSCQAGLPPEALEVCLQSFCWQPRSSGPHSQLTSLSTPSAILCLPLLQGRLMLDSGPTGIIQRCPEDLNILTSIASAKPPFQNEVTFTDSRGVTRT